MKQLTYQALVQWEATGKAFQLIDVREVSEHRAFNIGGILIPLNEIMRRTNEIEKTMPVVVYCKRGIRSQIAIQRWSQRLPEIEFYNLQGGILLLNNE